MINRCLMYESCFDKSNGWSKKYLVDPPDRQIFSCSQLSSPKTSWSRQATARFVTWNKSDANMKDFRDFSEWLNCAIFEQLLSHTTFYGDITACCPLTFCRLHHALVKRTGPHEIWRRQIQRNKKDCQVLYQHASMYAWTYVFFSYAFMVSSKTSWGCS